MFLPLIRLSACVPVLFLLLSLDAQQTAIPPAPANLTVVQILDGMLRHDQAQAKELKHYHSVRHYHADYHGFPTNLQADMEVATDFDSASGKTFRIESQSGSKLLCDKVLKKAVESEREASQDKSSTAFTRENYDISIVGQESVNGRPAYVLKVEPLRKSKFLYRGKVWVDAADFAIAKIEAEPAKNPSFLLSRTLIHYTSTKTDGFWLPRQNRSETKVRIGGTATLTIDYGTYTIQSADPKRRD